jgi:hypothetical protein
MKFKSLLTSESVVVKQSQRENNGCKEHISVMSQFIIYIAEVRKNIFKQHSRQKTTQQSVTHFPKSTATERNLSREADGQLPGKKSTSFL